MAYWLGLILDSTLTSYSRIFFSRNHWSGALLLLATLITPAHGLAGLLGAITGNLSAVLFGMDRETIRSGGYGFNGILLGLGLGAGYQVGWHFHGLMLLLGAILTGVTAGLNYLSAVYLGLPALSVPFLVMMKIAPPIAQMCGSLKFSTARWSLWRIDIFLTHSILRELLENLSAIFFQKNALVGAFALIAVLIDSRIAGSLLVLGFVTSQALIDGFSFSNQSLEVGLLGFNSMLTALAVGGYFAVPGLAATAYAVLSSACATLVMISIPSLAVPFNLTAILFGFLLRLRPLGAKYLKVSPHTELSPEGALVADYEGAHSVSSKGPWISLPFYGSWRMSQGIDGAFTHQGPWRFAYDFQAVDAQGAIFRARGERLEDYYSFGSPVVAAGPGIVRAVVDQVPDNSLGVPNYAQNWGNYVIIEHTESRFSCVAHLKKGSICVAQGDRVKRGQVLGQCGNSGRSLFPHLHFQMQAHPWIGAQTIEFEFENIMYQKRFHRRQLVILEGEEVRNVSLASNDRIEAAGGVLKVVDGMIPLRQQPTLRKLYEDIPWIDESVSMDWISGPERGVLSADRRLDRSLQLLLRFFGVSIQRLRHYRLERSGEGLGVQVRAEQFLESPWGRYRLKEDTQGDLSLKLSPQRPEIRNP